MKLLTILILILVISAPAFDIEKIPDGPQQILIEIIMAKEDTPTPPKHIEEYIIHKWGLKAFHDEPLLDTLKTDTL